MPATFGMSSDGLRIRPDPNDNAAGHPSPHSESGLVAVFEVLNDGDQDGQCKADIYVDDSFLVQWTSDPRAPGEGVNAVQPLGRLAAGDYTFDIYINPGNGSADHNRTGITVD